jgi:aspartate/methionine/tyrosine aminotransferase
MFSKRFPWDFRPNRLTQALAARRAAGARILDLTESNPTRAGFQYPSEILRAFDDLRTLAYEPSPAGMEETRRAVSAYHDGTVDPSRILLTASTSEAYTYLFKLLCNPGDQVLVPRPSYPLFECLAGLEAVGVTQYPLVYHDGWAIDLNALRDTVAERTRAIIVVNPNNPTGSYLKTNELGALSELCAARGMALISDEVFADYGFTDDPTRAKTVVNVDQCLAFALSGLSKVAGLPQMKLGWIAVSGPAQLRTEALERLEWIADAYLSVSTPVQCAGPRLLRAGEEIRRQICERTAANLETAREILHSSAATILAVEGGWYITLRMPRVRSEEEWTLELLERYGVLVQPGFFYDFEDEAYLVVSLLPPADVFRPGFSAIRAFL